MVARKWASVHAAGAGGRDLILFNIHMRPLSQLLITILERAIQSGATRAEVGRAIHWFRGQDLLDERAFSGDLTLLEDELRGLGAGTTESGEVSVQSPVGPIRFAVEFKRTSITLTFPITEGEAAGEVFFSELMAKLIELRGTHVICTARDATFKGGLHELATLPLVDGVYEELRVHGCKLGGLGPGDTRAGAVLYAGGRALRLQVLLEPGNITFAVEG